MHKIDSIQTQEDVNELFEYRDGDLYWKIDIYTGKNHNVHLVKIGDKACSLSSTDPSKAYKTVRYLGKNYIVSRLIFLMFYGYLSKDKKISYKDNNPLNTTIENLIESDGSQIQFRKRISSMNTTSRKGVTLNKHAKKYRADITINRKAISLGYYDTVEEASKAYEEAKKKYHGSFLDKCVS